MDAYPKFLLLNDEFSLRDMGEVFDVETSISLYGVNLKQLVFDKHYKATARLRIGRSNIEAVSHLIFTKKGIKKLLKTNSKMRERVNELYEECKYEFDLPYHEEVQL